MNRSRAEWYDYPEKLQLMLPKGHIRVQIDVKDVIDDKAFVEIVFMDKMRSYELVSSILNSEKSLVNFTWSGNVLIITFKLDDPIKVAEHTTNILSRIDDKYITSKGWSGKFLNEMSTKFERVIIPREYDP